MPQSRKISRVSIFLSLRTLSVLVVLFLQPFLFSQVSYNHPEIEWQSFETDHFVINFYDGTERTAREGAAVAETIYPFVTNVYDYETPAKTHITFLDTDDLWNKEKLEVQIPYFNNPEVGVVFSNLWLVKRDLRKMI